MFITACSMHDHDEEKRIYLYTAVNLKRNSQRLLIIFGRETFQFLVDVINNFQIGLEPAAWFQDNSRDLTHPNSEFLGPLRTAYYRQGNKRVEKRL